MPETDAVALLAEQIERVPIDSIEPNPANPNQGDVGGITESVDAVGGFYNVIFVQRSSGRIIAGEHRWRTLKAKGSAVAPVVWLDVDDDTAARIMVGDNEIPRRLSNAEPDRLAALLVDLQQQTPLGLSGTGFDDSALAALLADLGRANHDSAFNPQAAGPSLADRFLVPPFSIFDARQGYWQERKREWLALGIRSELGRPTNLLKMSDTVNDAMTRRPAQPSMSTPRSVYADPNFYWKKHAKEQELGRELSTEEFIASHYEADQFVAGTSVFDPVLCEVAYRWFSPDGARVLDPFAGGSVRGIVASRLGRAYLGVDLSAAQVEANQEQLPICREGDPPPRWVVGDGRAAGTLVEEDVDFVFSCPPYFDLEQYSDDPSDLSNAESFDAYRAALAEAVVSSCSRLRPGRFACFVVGNVRAHDKIGSLQDLGDACVSAFADAGLAFYNDGILVTAGGSIALRARQVFRHRKLARTHQQVLVFVKPPLDEALEACGPIEVADPAAAYGETFDLAAAEG